MSKYGVDFLLIRGKKIQVTLAELPQDRLKFYLENPRLYTMLRGDGKDPTQDEIEEKLVEMEHVKTLVQSIKDHGGLIDAVIVQSGTNIVLEGNSRLAAYRVLAKQDPIKWGKIRAKVLPDSISESAVFSLLGEYHIIGKKDWAPYEQAGYLYRRHKIHDVPIADLEKEIPALGSRAIGHLIEVYQFMIDHKERDVNRWSYYDEYLKSNKIQKARDQYPDFDKLIVKKIKSKEIERAVEIRDDLKLIVEAGGQVLDKFATGKRTFEQSIDAARNKGAGDQGVKRLKRFREWIGTTEAQDELAKLEGEVLKESLYELRRIDKFVSRMLKKLDGNGR